MRFIVTFCMYFTKNATFEVSITKYKKGESKSFDINKFCCLTRRKKEKIRYTKDRKKCSEQIILCSREWTKSEIAGTTLLSQMASVIQSRTFMQISAGTSNVLLVIFIPHFLGHYGEILYADHVNIMKPKYSIKLKLFDF